MKNVREKLTNIDSMLGVLSSLTVEMKNLNHRMIVELTQLRQEICKGESTSGDLIDDFLIANGDYSVKSKQFYRRVADLVNNSVGQFLFIIDGVQLSDGSCGGFNNEMPRSEEQQRMTLAVLGSGGLLWDIKTPTPTCKYPITQIVQASLSPISRASQPKLVPGAIQVNNVRVSYYLVCIGDDSFARWLAGPRDEIPWLYREGYNAFLIECATLLGRSLPNFTRESKVPVNPLI